ncbi:hypothetical protein K438DRAFT_1775262 [Mycena galopus ATCC 62051]|nr:hypothetical protein K438DRAFT_1775262 [Mycena galopus ATCC 62051]
MPSITHKLLNLLSVAVLITPGLTQQLLLNCAGGPTAFDCSSFASTFCTSIGNISINSINTYSGCFNGPGPNQSCVVGCTSSIEAISAVCPTGGTAMFTDGRFEFAVDPNTGPCGIPTGN